MWQDLIDKKADWIGGWLIEEDCDSPALAETELVDIRWADPAEVGGLPEDYIEFVGKDFTCGGRRSILGIPPHGHPQDGIRFASPYGMSFMLVKKGGVIGERTTGRE